ncbi:hypothetical protein jhhlp_000598 [Lomentospora prolificans]|uniref:C2H2-type domain-containing protein n=1 Tax=Lomentospora prolificans TaxID=41688 RepID=A0A2N3NJ03_9PEZI|nr:hypothetical protein jhhlp_000598 [Lomentospora prolificans]
MNEAPAEVLKEARQKILAMMDLGLSREALFNLVATSSPTAADSPHNASQQQQHQTQQQQQQPLPQEVKQEQPQPQQQQPLDNSPVNAPAPQTVYWQKPGPYHHRPRISVSSTSSGSSGRASIWSNTPSFASTSSGATHYSQSSSPLSQSQSLQSAQSGTTSPPAATQNSAGWPTGRLNFYWCTSCETRFKRKYDWKRHEEEFHERWKKYPCPEPGCNRSFWGANTFNQHHKASHGCKTCPHSEQVVKYLRKRKYWACGFCAALHPSRERHVEHVARHFEAGKTKADWTHSRVIYGLLHQPLIHEAWKDILTEKQGEFAGRQAQFSWNPTKTGRAQGFMENECPGQLQDLLEFFSGSSTDAEAIVRVAYDLADVVFMNGPFGPPASCVDTSSTAAVANATSYPTPPESTLSPVTPGTNIPSQPQPGMLLGEPTSPASGFPAFGNPAMMQPSMFSPTNAAPRPMSQQPLRRSSLERALPPPPPSEANPMTGAPMINIDYLQSQTGSGLMLEDWESFATTVVDDGSMQQPNQVPPQWPMVQYFGPQ